MNASKTSYLSIIILTTLTNTTYALPLAQTARAAQRLAMLHTKTNATRLATAARALHISTTDTDTASLVEKRKKLKAKEKELINKALTEASLAALLVTAFSQQGWFNRIKTKPILKEKLKTIAENSEKIKKDLESIEADLESIESELESLINRISTPNTIDQGVTPPGATD